MNLAEYIAKRAIHGVSCDHRRPRPICSHCRRAKTVCLCRETKTLQTPIHFLILMHPHESKRSVATGRMTHLCLENSALLVGENFTHCRQLHQYLENPIFSPFVLSPGPSALNLTSLSETERAQIVPNGKIPLIILIDGTWRNAKRMFRLSEPLHKIQRLCFVPPRLSEFRVRKQPRPEYFSTIEATHETLRLLGPSQGFEPALANSLLDVFRLMVIRQVAFDQRPKHPRSD